MNFNKEKWHVLCLGRKEPRALDKLGCDQLENSFAEKDLGVLVAIELNMRLQFVLEASSVLQCTRKMLSAG